MPKLTFPAAGEAMPGAEEMPIIGRFSRRPIIVMGDVTMAAAAMQIDRDAASIAAAMSLIDGGAEYRVWIDHLAGILMISRRSS